MIAQLRTDAYFLTQVNVIIDRHVDTETGEIRNESALHSELHALELDREDLLDRIADEIETARFETGKVQHMIRTFQEKKKRLETYENNLRSLAKAVMYGETVKTLTRTFYMIRSEKVDIVDEESIPSEYFVYTKKPDKKMIGDALRIKGELSGCKLIDTESLGIRGLGGKE